MGIIIPYPRELISAIAAIISSVLFINYCTIVSVKKLNDQFMLKYCWLFNKNIDTINNMHNGNTLIKIGVYGAIFDNEKNLLILKRASHDSHPGIWEIPGGALNFNEDLNQGVQREVYEETGLSVNALLPFAAYSEISTKGYQVIRIAYLCKLLNDSHLVKLSSEHDEYQWIDLEKIASINRSNFLDCVLNVFKNYPQILDIH
jgi:ADP-ribose pyrophosphatase YjhB (NUDIX family)